VRSLWLFINEAFRAALKCPLAFVGVVIGNIFFIIAGALIPLLVGRVIELAVPDGSREALVQVAVGWSLVTLLWLAGEWLLIWAAAVITAAYSHRARTEALRAVHADPFGQPDASGITTRLTADIDEVEDSLIEFLAGTINDFGRLLMVCAALTIIQPVIGLAFLAFMAFFVIFQRVVATRVDRANDDRQNAVDTMSGKLTESVRTVPLIHAYDLHDWDGGRFRERSEELRRATRRRALMGWWPYWAGATTGRVALIVILVIAAVTAQQGILSVAAVAASMMYVQMAVDSLLDLAEFIPEGQRAGVSVARVRELTDAAPPLASEHEREVAAAVTAHSGPVAVWLRDASITLPNGTTVLKPTTLELPAGKWTSIVGGSGAGKSTILGLVTGQRRLTAGTVEVAGMGVDEAHDKVRTSLVFQDSLLFNTSIAENIRAGDRSADDDAVREAARLAELHDVLEALPEGYATLVDTTGHLISGGQRQRLALARALVRRPQLLLLDEATSALDPQTAAATWRTMRRVATEQGITVLAVCHQLELAIDSDLLVVMQSGEVVESGSPRELTHSEGPWRELHEAHRRVSDDDLNSVMRLMHEHPELIPASSDAIAELARLSRVIDADAGMVVCERGDPLDELVLVSSGRIEVSDGVSRYALGAGSALGNLNDLITGRIAVDARMVSGGQLVFVPRKALLPSLRDLLDGDATTASAMAWLTRVERAPREAIAERLGEKGDELLDGLLAAGALRLHDDGQISVIVGSRRRSSVSMLDDLFPDS